MLLARYQVRRLAYQFDCIGTQHFGDFSPSVFDTEVVPRYPSQLPQSIFKGRDTRNRFRVVEGETHQHADAPYPLWLRARSPAATLPSCYQCVTTNLLPDLDFHVTLPRCYAHPIEVTIPRFERAVCDYFTLGDSPRRRF